MKTPQYTPLEWETEYDKHDNTIWTATSFVCIEEGDPCRYKIVPKLRMNQILWFDNSQDELGPPEDPWSSADEAKAAIEIRDMLRWDSAVEAGDIVFLGEDEE
jgi:hypothetical protein